MIAVFSLAAALNLTAAFAPMIAVAEPMTFICTNPASGARWSIRVDLAHRTVDSWPAAITARELGWHSLKDQGHYVLDRATGQLTITRASSTGGYQLHASCRPD